MMDVKNFAVLMAAVAHFVKMEHFFSTSVRRKESGDVQVWNYGPERRRTAVRTSVFREVDVHFQIGGLRVSTK